MKRISHKLIIWMVTSIFIWLPIANAAEQGNDKKVSATLIAEQKVVSQKEKAEEDNPKLETSVMDNLTLLSSTYKIYKDDNKTGEFCVQVEKQSFFSPTFFDESYYIYLFDLDSYRKDPIVFSKKQMPYIEVYHQNNKTSILFDDNFFVRENSIFIKLNKDTLEKAYNADKIFLNVYTSTGAIVRYELPKKVSSQWELVINKDVKKVKR